jgi:transposase
MEAQERKLSLRVMFQDEGRFGRIVDPRKCWAPKGLRPIVSKQIIREYTYSYAALSPKDGGLDTMILPYMDSPNMSVFLEEIAHRYPNDYILMVMDGASCHTSSILEVPDNIKPLALPPYSPQLNPVENLWAEIREKWFPNCVFDSMDAVTRHLIISLIDFESDPDRIVRLSQWPWIFDALKCSF